MWRILPIKQCPRRPRTKRFFILGKREKVIVKVIPPFKIVNVYAFPVQWRKEPMCKCAIFVQFYLINLRGEKIAYPFFASLRRRHKNRAFDALTKRTLLLLVVVFLVACPRSIYHTCKKSFKMSGILKGEDATTPNNKPPEKKNGKRRGGGGLSENNNISLYGERSSLA